MSVIGGVWLRYKNSLFFFSIIIFVFRYSFSETNLAQNQSTQVSKQRYSIEADYGFPLITGITIGYLIDPYWEASFGVSLPSNVYGVSGVDYFRFSIQGRYNLNDRRGFKGGVFQPYINFGYNFISGTEGSDYLYLPNGANTTEQQLQVGLGLEYFFLSNLGGGLTLDYTKTLFWNDSVPGFNVFNSPYYSWNSPSLSTDTSIIVPNFYLQFRF